MTREQFTALVEEALRGIPRRFRDAMRNVAVVVEDEPSQELLDDLDMEPGDTLFGLYHGIPLTERDSTMETRCQTESPSISSPSRRPAKTRRTSGSASPRPSSTNSAITSD